MADLSDVEGLLNLLVVIDTGQLLYHVYVYLAPLVSDELQAGPPAYELEIWLTSAMLAVTFPFLIVVADFFRFRLTASDSMEADES